MLKKPAWLLFAEDCRAKIASRERRTKSGRREESEIYRWYVEACEAYGYEGTEREWYYLLGWRGSR